jgi:putative flavoprotein involved in K+ transport
VRLRPRTSAADSTRIVFADGTADLFDAVIWAAGYQDDTTWVRIPGAIDTNGCFIERAGVSPVPGLFYVGRSWQTCRGSALLHGVGRDAARIAAAAVNWTETARSRSSPASRTA